MFIDSSIEEHDIVESHFKNSHKIIHAYDLTEAALYIKCCQFNIGLVLFGVFEGSNNIDKCVGLLNNAGDKEPVKYSVYDRLYLKQIKKELVSN